MDIIIDKDGTEYFPMTIGQIPVKNDGDIWITKLGSDPPTIAKLVKFGPGDWSVMHIGELKPWPIIGPKYKFLKQIKIPEIVEE